MKRIKTIADLTPDPHNTNKGTPRGAALLEKSLRTLGAGRSIVVDKNGFVIAGNQTLEQAAAIDMKIREVKTDGNELVVVRRMDLDIETDKTARALAIADNQTSYVGLDWNPDELQADLDAGVDLGEWFFGSELDGLGLKGGNRTGSPEPTETDGRKTCPHCGGEL